MLAILEQAKQCRGILIQLITAQLPSGDGICALQLSGVLTIHESWQSLEPIHRVTQSSLTFFRISSFGTRVRRDVAWRWRCR